MKRDRIYEVTVGISSIVDDRFFVSAVDFDDAQRLALKHKDRYEFSHPVDVLSVVYRGDLANSKTVKG